MSETHKIQSTHRNPPPLFYLPPKKSSPSFTHTHTYSHKIFTHTIYRLTDITTASYYLLRSLLLLITWDDSGITFIFSVAVATGSFIFVDYSVLWVKLWPRISWAFRHVFFILALLTHVFPLAEFALEPVRMLPLDVGRTIRNRSKNIGAIMALEMVNGTIDFVKILATRFSLYFLSRRSVVFLRGLASLALPRDVTACTCTRPCSCCGWRFGLLLRFGLLFLRFGWRWRLCCHLFQINHFYRRLLFFLDSPNSEILLQHPCNNLRKTWDNNKKSSLCRWKNFLPNVREREIFTSH